MSQDKPLSLVRDLRAAGIPKGTPFRAVLIVKRIDRRTSKNGNPFLNLELADRTGSVTVNCFFDSLAYSALHDQPDGVAVLVEGDVDYFQERLSPRLRSAEVLSEEELERSGALSDLVEVPPEEPAALWSELESLMDSIPHAELRATVRDVFNEIGEEFRNSPAAISMHHAYRHGLLEHTVHVARVCQALLPLYPEVDPSLALAGALLHDVGKTVEYEGALSSRRGRTGLLQGHVVLGYRLVRRAGRRCKVDPDRLERLEHIVLSHQGELEWGAAVKAATPEAVFISQVDDLDAKMGMVQRALRTAAEGEEFSERIHGLDAHLLTRPLS